MRHLLIVHCVVGLLCATSLDGCSLFINTSDRQCKSNEDCVAAKLGTLCVQEVCAGSTECQGPACSTANAALGDGHCTSDSECSSPNAPRCLNKNCVSSEIAESWVCTADDQTIRSSSVRYSFHIVDFLSREPPKNIVAKACRSNDVGCAEPVATFTDADGTGHAQFDLPSGFFGFFEIRSASLPALLYVTKPIVKNTLNRDVPVLTAETVQLTATVTGIAYDPAKGLAILEAIDCSDTPAGGVQFKLTGDPADQFYLVDQVPSREAMVTAYDDVNNTADGGFINVQPGFVTFSARLGVDGLELGTFNSQIRANTITFIDMHF
jgi:hypothetical protein